MKQAITFKLLLAGATACVLSGGPAALAQASYRTIFLRFQVVTLPKSDSRKLIAQARGDDDKLRKLLMKLQPDRIQSTDATTMDGGYAMISATSAIPYIATSSLAKQQTNFIQIGRTAVFKPLITTDNLIEVYITLKDSQMAAKPAPGDPPAINQISITTEKSLANGDSVLLSSVPFDHGDTVQFFILRAKT